MRSFLTGTCLVGRAIVITLIVIFPVFFHTGYAQIVRVGATAGAQMTWVKSDSPTFMDSVRIDPMPGFRVGGVVSFKVKDRYFLHTEYVYSRKGKIVTGKIDDMLKDRVTYHYLEVPVLFTRHFKASLGGEKEFKWYMGIGPNISYWISGKGRMEASDLFENGLSEIHYKIAFGPRLDTEHPLIIYYDKANRYQFGLNVGGGVILEPVSSHKIMLDVRYTFDQTHLGRSRSSDHQIPPDYVDNLKARNRGVKFSVIYLLEYNLDKKERNKGKSTLKQ